MCYSNQDDAGASQVKGDRFIKVTLILFRSIEEEVIMKKFMALSMAAIMALTVAGCGSKPAETTAAGTTAAETAANAEDVYKRQVQM